MALLKLIAYFRVIILPVIILLLYQETLTSSLGILILLSLALLSYFWETKLKIKQKFTVRVGSFLEPFADLVLFMALLFFLVLRKEFSLFIFSFFVLRYIIVGIIRGMAAKEDVLIKGVMSGQLFTYSLFGIVFSTIIKTILVYENSPYFSFAERALTLFTLFAVIIAAGSILSYGLVYLRQIRNREKMGKKLKEENMVILANPKSRGYRDKYRRKLLKRFSRRRGAPLIYLPQSKDMFKGRGERIEKYNQVIIAGGDGSFESALNYPPFEKKSLGFFPLGAGNAFYSYFYKGKQYQYLRSRFPFREMDLDILELEWEKGKVQTVFLTLGADAEVVRLGKERTEYGFIDYLKASAKAAAKAKVDYDFTVKIDDRKTNLKNCVNFIIGKVPYYGYGIRSLLGVSGPSDGTIEGLACVNTHALFLNKLMRLWALTLTMLGIYKAPLLVFRGKKLEISSEVPFPVQAGGEYLGYTPFVRIKVKRKQKVLVI